MPDLPDALLPYKGAIVVGVIVVIVLGILRRLLGGQKEESSHNIKASCKACGWRGSVSKFARKCPKCNAAL